jgi:hypothetical protein
MLRKSPVAAAPRRTPKGEPEYAAHHAKTADHAYGDIKPNRHRKTLLAVQTAVFSPFV